MEWEPRPDTVEKLNDLARRTGRGIDELLEEGVDHLLAFHNWTEREAKGDIATPEEENLIPDEEVLAWLEQREQRERSE